MTGLPTELRWDWMGTAPVTVVRLLSERAHSSFPYKHRSSQATPHRLPWNLILIWSLAHPQLLFLLTHLTTSPTKKKKSELARPDYVNR